MLPTHTLFLLGATMLAAGAFGLWWGRSARKWEEVEARVVDASIQEERAIARFPHSLYTPAIRFEYEVDGLMHVGNRLSVIPSDFQTADRRQAEAFVAGYPPGSRTTVRVKPGAPSVAVLRPKASARSMQHHASIALSGCLLLMMGSVVYGLRHAP